MDSGRELQQNLEQYYSRIFRAITAFTHGSGLDPDDLTQETFLKAWKNRESFEGASSIYTWLYRIARNTCIDAMRKTKITTRKVVDDEFDENLYDTGDSADSVELNENQGLLRKALAAMEEELRILIVLKDLQGLRYHEISEITETTEGTVKSRLFRARLQLKQELMKLGYRP